MPTTRLATPADAPRLTELMVIMHDSIDGPHPPGPWVQACEDATLDRLTNDPAFVAHVAEADGAGVVAFATGEVRRRFPGPKAPASIYGYGITGGTDPDHRHQGLFMACWTAVIDELVRRGCERISIFSSKQAEPLHRGLGFERHDDWPVPMNLHVAAGSGGQGTSRVTTAVRKRSPRGV
ncbi:acetyltransferase (GNAT) family protein [Haloactinopolyspora alba]|uniref:Acetyltransferase (GNAT) family protein n=1 Tax=Haloactinopolyspora alba TaxID=648780 RepID=A0A2P8E935_9ACTN|nr:GNAT family N-acetyltransferase [Haloactinopolyspora alba]PSL05975.1 acetyltransferase (GNAT) family protein [Haloactinopolyspora alba]